MSTSTEVPGAAAPGLISRREHEVHFYSHDHFLTDDLRDFIGDAISRGCSAIVIGTKAHNDVLLRKLGKTGIDMANAIAEGRYLPLDASEVLSRFLVDGSPDEKQFYEIMGAVIAKATAAAREPGRRVVAFGEMVALLWAEGKTEEAIELEKLWNRLANSYAFGLRCAYPLQGFRREVHADAFMRICEEHTAVGSVENRMALKAEGDAGDGAALKQGSKDNRIGKEDWSKREECFRLLVTAVQDYAIFMLDTDGRITSWNAGAEGIKGYKPAEIIGRHLSVFYPPEEIAAGKPQRLLRKAEQEGHAEDEGWRVRKNGERFWARVTLTAIRDEAGKLIGFGKVTRDLTLQKKAEEATRRQEERFSLFVNAVQDYALFLLDSDGYVSSWNTGAERIKGYKASEIIGKHFSVFYPEEDLRAGKPERALKIAARDGRYEDEDWRVRKDGSKFWASVLVTAIRDETGKLIGFGKVTRDLTEKMRIRQALEESQEKLKGSEKSLRELSLHLLRTQDDERRRIGREMHDSLGQYLALLKIKLNSISPRPKELEECASLVDESLTEVRTISYLLYPPMLEEMGLSMAIPWYLEGFSKRSGIQTTFSTPDDLDRLPAEAELVLFRVLQECLTNVQRHSGSKNADIRVFRDNNNVTLEVRDRGKGVPKGVLEHAQRDWMGSQGVGVRGMSERLRQLGGTLEIASDKKGTRVRAMVPAADLGQPAVEADADAEPAD